MKPVIKLCIMAYLIFIFSHLSCINLTTEDISNGTFLPHPEISSVTPLSFTALQVTFAQDMNETVSRADCYSIVSSGNELSVIDVTTVNGSDNRIVKIITSTQASSELYTLTVKNVVTSFGKRVSEKGITAVFFGYVLNTNAPDINIKSGGVSYASGGVYLFLAQESGTSSNSVQFTIENSGIEDLLLSDSPVISVSGNDPSMFIIEQPDKTLLAMNEACTFNVTFSPGGSGEKSAVIHIRSNDISKTDFILTFIGTALDTVLAANIHNTANSSPSYLTAYNSGSGEKLYFNAFDGINGAELWVYDGSTASMAADINSTGSSNPEDITVYNDKIYFNADDGINGAELWVYNGSGASMAADINSAGSSYPQYITVYNNKLCFMANDGSNGYELWVYDGTTASMAADINSGPDHSSPRGFAIFNSKLYFLAKDNTNGEELRVYYGTTVSLVADIAPGSSGGSPTYLTVYNNKLYFQAYSTTNGSELWTYDGGAVIDGGDGFGSCSTGDNPCMVVDINPGSNSSNPQHLQVFNNSLYFNADDGTNGIELWVYDGSTTSMAADINSAGSSNPQHLTVFNNNLYFNATNGTNGYELWVYDGSTASMVYDIYTGTTGSNPNGFTVFNGSLYFQANDPYYGIELWRYNPNE